MKRISGLLSKQLNQMLNKEVNNTSFLEDELSSIISLKISKRDLPYLDYFENVEDLIIEAFPSITSEDILFIGEKLTKIKSLKIKEQLDAALKALPGTDSIAKTEALSRINFFKMVLNELNYAEKEEKKQTDKKTDDTNYNYRRNNG